jgi:glycerophosphoryl diester phosphodiesterase
VTTVITPQHSPNHNFFDRFAPRPLIIAHRGYRAWYPENTFSAFAASLGRCRMIELDVRLCRDGTAVVFHDSRLTRTSNAGLMARDLGLTSLDLADWRSDQLRRLDAGSWSVETDPFGTLMTGGAVNAGSWFVETDPFGTLRRIRFIVTVSLPFCRSVFPHCKRCWPGPRYTACRLTLKSRIWGRPGWDSLVVDEVIRLVRAAGMSGMVVLSSFNHDYLRACRRRAPEIATAALQQRSHPKDLVPYLRSLGVCAYHPENIITDQALVHTLRAAGLTVNVFTVNDPARRRRLLDWGVTGVFTDFLEQEGGVQPGR